MDVAELLKSYGVDKATHKNLKALGHVFASILSETWECTYKKQLVMKSGAEDKYSKVEEYELEQQRIIDKAIEVYKVIYNIRYRYAATVLSDRKLINEEIALCKTDVEHFIMQWCFVHEPRMTSMVGTDGQRLPTSLPFIPYDKQADILKDMETAYRNRYDLVVAKSREAGISWIAMGFTLHKFLYDEGSRIGIGSEKEIKVDSIGSSNPLFGKIRYMLYKLPNTLRPKAFKKNPTTGNDGSNNHYDNHLRMINPDNGAEIIGEVGRNVGRSGRYSAVIIDESQDITAPEAVDAGLESATECRIDIGTSRGQNHFYRRYMNGGAVTTNIMWYHDPRKNPEFAKDRPNYDCWWRKNLEEKHKSDQLIIAQEYDMEWSQGSDTLCIPPAWVQAAINFDIELTEGERTTAGFDLSGSGKDSSVYIARTGGLVHMPKKIEAHDPVEAIWGAYNYAKEDDIEIFCYDKISVGETLAGVWYASGKDIPFTVFPIAGNAGATHNIIKEEGLEAVEIYYNLRSEIWHNLRDRFKKTFEYVTKGIKHDHSELISIPNHKELVAQLSYPNRKPKSGRWIIESKPEMRARGLASPDFADAIAYAMYDPDANAMIKSRGKTRKGVFKKLDVDYNDMSWEYFASVLYEDDTFAVTVSRWHPYRKDLQVFASFTTGDALPDSILERAGEFVSEYILKKVTWVGEKKLFDDFMGNKGLMFQYLRKAGIKIRFNQQENSRIGIMLLSDMFSKGGIVIDTTCMNLVNQVTLLSVNDKMRSGNKELRSVLLTLQYLKAKRKLDLTDKSSNKGYKTSIRDKDSQAVKKAALDMLINR